ncbi:hypothetical protein BJL83_20805 [Vibrio parahaemolyticus]|nr:hypothetical protein BJL83_20805 [Vibrio parahaemolyticus]
MNNILPVLKNPEMLTYQRALGIISCLAAMDSRMNTSWTLESLYQAIVESVEQGNYQVSCNSLGQPESVYCWKEYLKQPYLSVNPFSDSESHKPPAHINPESYDFYRYFGNAFELLSFSNYHKMFHIEYLQREILPPIWYQQLMVYFDERDFPCAFFSWARISSVVEERIQCEKIGLMWNDWIGGERLFVNDLVAPWGGSRYVIRDMRERVFPYDKGAKGIRRKVNLTADRTQHFKALRANVQLDPNLIETINTFIDFPGTFDEYENIIGRLDEFKSHYELATLLDKNNACAELDLEKANECYCQALSRLQSVLEVDLALKEQRAVDYLKLEEEVVPVAPSAFILDNRLIKQELEMIREWLSRTGVVVRSSIPPQGLSNGQEHGRLNCQQVMSYFRHSFATYLPELAVTCDEMMGNIQLDLRGTVDKIDRPFAKQRGNRLPIYISVSFDGSAEDSINLIHELSHALLYTENSRNTSYLFIEDRPLVNEVFAFFGEFIYLAYLRKYELSTAALINSAEMAKDQYYFDECMPLLEKALTEMDTETEDYSAVYPLARKLAYSLAQGVVAGRLQSVDSVIQMCRLGREFPLGTLLTQLMNSKNSLCF